MNQDYIISALVFTIVMVIFNILKDTIIRSSGYAITPTMKKRFNTRWAISYGIGLLILFLMYGRNGP